MAQLYSVQCKRSSFGSPCGVHGDAGLTHAIGNLFKILLICALQAEQFC